VPSEGRGRSTSRTQEPKALHSATAVSYCCLIRALPRDLDFVLVKVNYCVQVFLQLILNKRICKGLFVKGLLVFMEEWAGILVAIIQLNMCNSLEFRRLVSQLGTVGMVPCSIEVILQRCTTVPFEHIVDVDFPTLDVEEALEFP
jgi:hypothetical protein